MVSGVSGLTQYLLANRDLAKATEDYNKGSPTYQRAVDAFRTLVVDGQRKPLRLVGER